MSGYHGDVVGSCCHRNLFHFQNEAIYLYSEGSSVDTCRQLLKEKVSTVNEIRHHKSCSYNYTDFMPSREKFCL